MELNLYQIEEEGRRLLALLDSDDGEMSPEVEAILTEWEQTQLVPKAESYAMVIRHFEAKHLVFENEMKRMQAASKFYAGRSTILKERLKSAMDRLGLKKIDTRLFKLAIQTNGGNPSVKWDGPLEEIPQELRKEHPPELDCSKALECHKAGEAPAALIVERGSHLRIR